MVLSNGVEDTSLQQFFLVLFIRLTIFFQTKFGLISYIILLKEFVSIINKKTGKRHFLTFHGISCKEENKCFINNRNPVESNYDWKTWVEWISTNREKKLEPQKTCIFRKRVQKLKNIYAFKRHLHFLHFMTTFHNFTLKIEL